MIASRCVNKISDGKSGEPSGHPVGDNFGVEPPRAVHVRQVLLEDAVLQHVLGHSLATVDQTPESAENITGIH